MSCCMYMLSKNPKPIENKISSPAAVRIKLWLVPTLQRL